MWQRTITKTSSDKANGLSEKTKTLTTDLHISDNVDISMFPNVVRLVAISCLIKNIDTLEKCTKLKDINLAKNSIKDTTPLLNLCLENVNLSDNMISQIVLSSGNMRVLNLSKNDISTIAPLATFAGLVDLDLSFNFLLGGHEALRSLPNIKRLSLEKTGLTSLSFLDEGFTKLEVLNISCNDWLEDLCFEKNLSNLKELSIREMLIRKIEGFDNLTSLRKLDAKGTCFDDHEFLAGLRLEELSLNNMSTGHLNTLDYSVTTSLDISSIDSNSSFDFLLRAINLTNLSISSGKIIDLRCFKNLVNLKKLDLVDCEIEHLAGVHVMKDLEYLSVVNSSVSDLKPLNHMNDLKNLDIRNAKIVKLGNLSLPNLEILGLNDNPLVTLKGVDNLHNLKILAFNNCFVRDLSPLSNSHGLNALLFDGNYVDSLYPIKDLPNISKLSHDNNCLQNNSHSPSIKTHESSCHCCH